MIIRFQN